MEMDVEAYLRRRYESQIADIEILEKEDLDLVSLSTSKLGFAFLTSALTFNSSVLMECRVHMSGIPPPHLPHKIKRSIGWVKCAQKCSWPIT